MVDVGPAGASSSGNSQNNSNSGEEDKKDERMFECNICLDTAKDAVVSMCGHLFCWPCLHQWLETRPARQMCPVCKAAISKEKVIPLYGRGSSKQEDPRNKAPPRPAGQRSEPEPNATEEEQWWDSGDEESSSGSESSHSDFENAVDMMLQETEEWAVDDDQYNVNIDDASGDWILEADDPYTMSDDDSLNVAEALEGNSDWRPIAIGFGVFGDEENSVDAGSSNNDDPDSDTSTVTQSDLDTTDVDLSQDGFEFDECSSDEDSDDL